jgi:CRISPR-associated protein Csx17
MPTDSPEPEGIDWSLTTWQGARREQMRRWSQMSLSEMIRALEEMQVLAEKLSAPGVSGAGQHRQP